MSFRDDDEDLNVDFDMDTDDDDVRNDGGDDVPRAVPSSDFPDMATQGSDSSERSDSKNTNEPEETADMDSVGHEEDDQKKTEDSRSSSAVPITGTVWWL